MDWILTACNIYFFRLLPDFLREMFEKINYVKIVEQPEDIELINKYKR